MTLTAAAACASRSGPMPPVAPVVAEEVVDTALAVLTFDSAWSRIAHSHFDTTFNGVDWDGVRSELRPQAASAHTLSQLRIVIGDMLGRLGQSHFSLIPREAAGALDDDTAAGGTASAGAGLELRLVGDEFLVWRLDPRGAAAAAGIQTGWSLVSSDGRPTAPSIAAVSSLDADQQRVARTRLLYRTNAALSGQVGTVLDLAFRTGSGAVLERRVLLRPLPGQLIAYGSLPPVVATLHSQQVALAGGCAGVIRFTMWLVPLAAAFDRAVDEHRSCAGMIIDLRGNPGGVAGMVMGTAGHFLDDTLALGFMTTRTLELRFKANPRRVRRDGSGTQPFTGRLAVLTDEMTASTSEFFAEALQAVGRARVFGTRSAGQALPALMSRLPTGDVLVHAVADFRGPDGFRIEGRGVVPDEIVESTREDLLEQRDAPLDAALAWIAAGVAVDHHSTGDTGHENR